ncbi:type IV pilus secretin PilQ [Uliginosibacterium sp. H1]|uniref:type IV pilus secretin PilQ n=1 Tax=Uliginosibacterium sp. H1 TaxID=3114757 RepID=UPI002E1848C9|nr:type IV pilus secretin PilQ [Uliginosibacterium sp. H1]
MTRTIRLCAALMYVAGVMFASGASAQSPAPATPAAAEGRNAIESIRAEQNMGVVTVRITLRRPLEGQLGTFSVSNPARVAIDFPATSNATGSGSKALNEGDVRSANLVQVADRTRLVLNLTRPLAFETKNEGRDVVINLTAATSKSPEATTTARFVEQKGGPDQHSINDIAFRRGKDGEARLVIDLSDSNTGIDIRQQGSNLVLEFLKTAVPDRLKRRLDVTDFGTPVTDVVTTQQGNAVRIVVAPKGLWEHSAYQSDNQFVLEVKSVQEDPRKLVQSANKAVKYAGEKLSLNFQNIDVRSVLQVIADFTNFNIITSDTVTGALTLRLKDVPWDQALEIILQAKGLDMRKNGNVIWIAPSDELATREKLELEAKSQIQDLEPLRTESFQINYHKARAISDFMKNKEQTILSKRGSVVVDERTNKVFVNDVGARLDDIRRLLTEIDVPVRQVLIEAQIVEASDAFARNIGMRLGLHMTDSAAGRYRVGGGLADTGYHTGQTSTVPDFLNDSLSWNNPAPSLSSKNVGALSLVLWNSAATRFLNLEVTALETDGRGKVVSRPRVMTADQTEATIEQGTELPYKQSTSSGATSVAFRKAVLALKVKPQITPDGKIFMTLDVNKDTPNERLNNPDIGYAIDTKHVKTEVLVENGGTVVIGGIFQQDIRNNTAKVPLLGDIPVLGYLFKENERQDTKTELLVFITPRIVSDQTLVR